MALRIEYEASNGLTCNYAHCVVGAVDAKREIETNPDENGDPIETNTFPVHYSGKIYASDDAYADEASPIGGFNGKFEMDNGGTKNQYNLIKQAYLDLKTMDGFTDGTDV